MATDTTISIAISKKDKEILDSLCNEFGEGKSAVLKRALNELYINHHNNKKENK